MENQDNTMNSTEPKFENRLDLGPVKALAEALRTQFREVLVGQHHQVDYMLAALLAGGHVLVEGVPGLAKTLMARLMAASVGVDYRRIQFTPDLMPSDVTGTSVFNPKTLDFAFVKGPVFANFVLIDEINRAPAKTQAALFEVMEEATVTVAGESMALTQPFFVAATQNPIEHEGTYRLPEAQTDRFLFKIEVTYPAQQEEASILKSHHTQPAFEAVKTLKPVTNGAFILQARELVRRVHVEDRLIDYITALTAKSRNHSLISLGGSPRASLAVMNGAKAMAALSGRDFVTPEDIQHVFYPAMRHRIILSAEAEMSGRRPDDVLRMIMDSVEVPR
jgi:MoxR-like ATPase